MHVLIFISCRVVVIERTYLIVIISMNWVCSSLWWNCRIIVEEVICSLCPFSLRNYWYFFLIVIINAIDSVSDWSITALDSIWRIVILSIQLIVKSLLLELILEGVGRTILLKWTLCDWTFLRRNWKSLKFISRNLKLFKLIILSFLCLFQYS